jgi:CubicO group peptidase (beta-lactamase class C family)
MRKLFVAILPSLALATLLLRPSLAIAQPVDTAALDGLVQEALQTWQVPGVAVVVVRGDRVVYLKGLGVRDVGTRRPVTADTVFPLASCTKAFTSTAIAMLVDEGKMGWDDPVRKHVPFFRLADPLADAEVTVRDLLCHRTGVASHDLLWYRSPHPPEEIVRRLRYLQPSKSFRAAFQYQSSMYTAAGCAVGKASQSSWGDFVQKRIFTPLEMTASSVTTKQALKAADHASPHRKNSEGKIAVIPWYPIVHPEPAGSVNVTARDLGNWLLFQLGEGTWKGKRLVSAAALGETHTPQIPLRLEGIARAVNPFTTQMSYGLGWVVQDYRGQLQITHVGSIDGFRAHVAFLPQAKLGIGILSNLQATRMNNALANTLVDHLLRHPAHNWHAHFAALVQMEEESVKAQMRELEERRQRGTKPSRELTHYTGQYEDPAYGSARVVLERGGLVWEWNTFRLPLEHYHYNTFLVKDESLFGTRMVVFNLNADGDVAGMKLMDMDITFRKK